MRNSLVICYGNLEKKQRAHNYEQKDFLSAKNLFELNRLF